MLSTQTQQSMSSLELATLVDKEHKNVIRDIRTQILEGLYSVKDGSDLSHEEIQGVTVKRDARGYTSEILLDRYHTDILVSGYEVKYRAAIVKRWHELEAQQKPLTQLEMLAQSVLAQVEQERRLTATEQKVEAIATKIEHLEVDLRNGVPHGFLSKANAHKQCGKGLSKAIFEAALLEYKVTTKNYVHIEQGHSSSSFAYKEDEIETAVDDFISNAEQVTKTMCYSKLLNKRFGFIKGE